MPAPCLVEHPALCVPCCLRAQLGLEVEAVLGVQRVGQLAALSSSDLAARFGPQLGTRLAQLPFGQDGDAPVRCVMRCGVVWCGVVWYGVVWCGVPGGWGRVV